MSVYKHRNSPFWQFDFVRSGYRFSGSTGIKKTKPRREAEAVEKEECRAAERLVEEIRRSGRRPMTVANAFDRWWTEIGEHLSETDLRTRLDWLRDELGAKTLLHDVTADDVTKAMTARRLHVVPAGRDDDGKQLYRPIGARTVNRTVPMLLRRVTRRAVDLWNVVILREPKWGKLVLKEIRRPIEELSLATEDALDAQERADYQPCRRFATIMGLRLKEALLIWPQVDFDAAEIRIVGKGDKPAVLPLTREAYEILWAERERDPLHVFTFEAMQTQRRPNGVRYIKGQRYPITYWGLTSHRRRNWKKAGAHGRFHDLRHTTGRRHLRATGNLKSVQQLLRHSDISTTARFYADVLLEDVRAGMEKTAADISSRKESRRAREAPAKALKRR